MFNDLCIGNAMYYLRYKDMNNASPIILPGPRVHAEYRCILRNAENGAVVHDTGWEPNMVLDNGLGQMTVYGSWWYQIAIGDSNVAVDRTQTGVQSWIATRAMGSVNGAPNNVYTDTGTYPDATATVTSAARFDTSVTGTIREIGATRSGANNDCSTRAVLASPFTKTSSQILDVYYQMHRTRDGSYGDFTGQIDISGTTYNYTARAMRILQTFRADAFMGPFGNYITHGVGTANLAEPLNTQYDVSGCSPPYGGAPVYGAWGVDGAAGTAYREWAITWGLNNGNPSSGGVRGAYSRMDGSYGIQVEYSNAGDSSAIPKDNTKSMTLNFRMEWSR